MDESFHVEEVADWVEEVEIMVRNQHTINEAMGDVLATVHDYLMSRNRTAPTA